MARVGAGGPAGRINRRFLVLALVSAALSALLVYVALSNNSGDGGGTASATSVAVVAAVDIPARTQVTADMLELRDVPENVKSQLSYESMDDVVGKVTRYPISIDEQVTSLKVVSVEGAQASDALAFVIPDGMRAISISADQVLSAGGLVLPGDYVDIIAVFDVKSADGSREEESYFVRTILQNVEVLAVAQTIADVPLNEEEEEEDGSDPATTSVGQRGRGSEADPDPKATTLTLLVQPEQAEWLFLAESNGTLRAVVRSFGDAQVTEVRPIVETELWPAGMPVPQSSNNTPR